MRTWSEMSRTKVTEPVNPERVPPTQKTHPIRVSRVAKYRKIFKAVTSSITSTTGFRSDESEELLFSGLNLGRQHHHAPGS